MLQVLEALLKQDDILNMGTDDALPPDSPAALFLAALVGKIGPKTRMGDVIRWIEAYY